MAWWLGLQPFRIAILISLAVAYYDKDGGKTKELPAILTKGRTETWIRRVQSFIYADKQETAYQVQQAKIAIAKGGWMGLGPGNSEAA